VDLNSESARCASGPPGGFGDHWKLDLELQTFSNLSEKGPLFNLEDDGFIRFDFGYFF
jgi:hypothetical protein